MGSRKIISAVGAVVVAVVMAVVLVRCTSDDAETSSEPVEAPIVYEGALEGMRGTRPLAVSCGTVGTRCVEDQNPEWAKQLNDFWVSIGNEPLESYEFASEAFDSTIVAALAAEAAGTDGSALADKVVGLTRDGTKCTEFAECIALVREGVDIDYDGKSGKFTMNGLGEVVDSNYAVVEFGSNNRIDPDRTEYRELAATWAFVPRPAPVRTRTGDGTLKVASLLPLTGQLATYGPPQFAGVEYAVSVINEAGGALGKEVEYVQGDCGDTSTLKAEKTVERLLADNVDVIVGPSSTAVTKNVIETILGAGIVQFSPANTNMELVDYEDNGLYFRAAPADDVQTYLLGLVLDEDNASRVHIVHSDDLYGNSVATRLQTVLKQRGIEVAAVTPYEIAAASYADVIDALVKSDTDTVVMIGFDEIARLLREMVTANIGPKFRKVYGVDAIMGDALGENFDNQS
jgi:ABC-type branched-subunit amino acid transport system substrate-binding protein